MQTNATCPCYYCAAGELLHSRTNFTSARCIHQAYFSSFESVSLLDGHHVFNTAFLDEARMLDHNIPVPIRRTKTEPRADKEGYTLRPPPKEDITITPVISIIRLL